MPKGKNAAYVTAGLQAASSERFFVRSGVYLPDAEAGRADDTQRTPYRAGAAVPARPALSVTWRAAVIFWCALFVLFGGLLVSRAARRAALTKSISETQRLVETRLDENAALALQVKEARDILRISSLAESRLHMHAPTEETTYRVTAPDTRPLDTLYTAETADAPQSAPDGIMTGSR